MLYDIIIKMMPYSGTTVLASEKRLKEFLLKKNGVIYDVHDGIIDLSGRDWTSKIKRLSQGASPRLSSGVGCVAQGHLLPPVLSFRL